jgi:hypothetical protein
MQRDRSWILLILTVLGLVTVPKAFAHKDDGVAVAPASAGAGPHEQTTRALTPAETSASPPPKPIDPAWIAERRRDVAAALGHATGMPPDEALGHVGPEDGQKRRGRIYTLVASVPDPRSSHMALYFDQSVEALLSSATAVDFIEDRFVFPWPKPKRDASRAAESHAEEPGAGFVLFRSAAPSAASDFLLVFLVTESPLLGADRAVLQSTLDLASELTTETALPLHVLGPFFSGSAASLAASVDEWRGTSGRNARIITGTATAPRIAESFQRPGIEFSRTIANDDELLHFLLCQIDRGHDRAPPTIALLREIGTLYGSSGSSGSDTRSAADALPCEGDSRSPPPRPREDFVFPLHISQLRAARERTQPTAGEQADTLRRTLELKLDPEDETSPDTPPVFSDLTPYDVELSLRQLLQRICADRIEYLVIVATDPVDVVFLAQQTKKYCPGTALVTLGTDLLYSHPDLRSTLTGTLIASTYPLLFESRAITAGNRSATAARSPGQRQAFPSQGAQGFNNASLALLGELLFHDEPAKRPSLYQYAPLLPSPSCPDRGPQLWLTMVANGGLWPITTTCSRSGQPYQPARVVTSHDPPADDRATQPASLTHEKTDPPRAARRPLLAIKPTGVASGLAALFLFLTLCHLTMTLVAATRRRFRVLPDGPISAPELARCVAKNRYELTAHVTLAAMTMLGVPAALYVAGSHSVSNARFMFVVTAVTVAGILAAAAAVAGGGAFYTLGKLFLEPAAREPLDRPRRRWHPAAATVVSFVVIGWVLSACAGWLVWRADLSAVDNLLLVARTVDPLGMSPLAPLGYLAAGLYLWGICGIRRVSVLERFSGLSPLPSEAAHDALRNVTRKLRGIWDGGLWRSEVFAIVLLTVPGVYFWRRLLPTFEGEPYDALLKAGFLALYGTVGFAFVQFIILWRLLARFLTQIAGQPMVNAYDRVAVKVSGSFGLQLSARVPDARELEVSAYNCRALVSLATDIGARDRSPAGATLAQAAPRLAPYALQLQKTTRERSSEPPDSAAVESVTRGDTERLEADVHTSFFGASTELFGVLQKLWDLRVASPDAATVAQQVDIKQLLPGGDRADIPTAALFMGATSPEVYLWMRMAEDFVAMRVATFIHHVLFQLRNLLVFALVGSLLLALAAAAYPLQPARFVTIFAWLLVFLVIAGSLYSIVLMERNEILSRLARSTPGRIDFNFALVGHLFVYVVLPSTAVLANIFPEVSDLLFAWLQPLERLLP